MTNIYFRVLHFILCHKQKRHIFDWNCEGHGEIKNDMCVNVNNLMGFIHPYVSLCFSSPVPVP